MKCEHCGHNLQIEDKVCPYCGQPNPFAVQHQKEMQRFSRRFQETREDVLEQSSRLSRRTVRIAILAVLVALVAVMAFLCVKGDDIRWWKMEKEVAANRAAYTAQIERLMAERDYSGVYAYFDKNHLSYSEAMREYDAVYTASMYYRRFYEDLMILLVRTQNEEIYRYYSEDELISGLAQCICSSVENMEVNEYRPEEYSEDKMAYMEDAMDMMKTMVQGYFGVSEEEADAIDTMTESRLTVMLEDAYESKYE